MIINGKEWAYKTVKLKELIPNDKNPRTITKDAFERLQKKINDLGFHSPLKIDNEKKILGGNQRWAALSAMGFGDVEVPVMYPLFQLTEKEKQEIIITDNIQDGDWNMEDLANYFDTGDLIEWGMDIPWQEQPLDKENPGATTEEFDVDNKKVKIIFKYKDSHEIIDKFLREMQQKYPELLYEVEIDD